MHSEDLFTSYKPAIHQFPRRQVVGRGYIYIVEHVEADVAYMDNYADENQGIKYLAIFICVFSRRLWVYYDG